MRKILYILLVLLLLTSCGVKKQEVSNNKKIDKKAEQIEVSTLGGGLGIPSNEKGKR